MSYDSDSIGGAGNSAMQNQLVEAQMKRVHQKIDQLEMQRPPSEEDLKEAARALKQAQSMAGVLV